ncbi:Gustatory receptor 180 [Halyomorpha halys]|nr:Gustatory receptor 180 [Halyomorpha halys]
MYYVDDLIYLNVPTNLLLHEDYCFFFSRPDKEMAEEFVRLTVNKQLRLARYLLLFPHVVEGKTFQTTLARKWLCWVVTVFLAGISFWVMAMVNEQNDTFNFLLWGPLVSSYITLLINQIWMHTKKDKLDDFLSNLHECRPYLEASGKESMMESFLPTLGQFLINVGLWFYVTFKEQHINFEFSMIYLYFQLGLFLCNFMLEQFILLLSLVRHQLSRTALLADTNHDALIAAAIDLNKVFSPHLLVIIMTLFVALLGKLYQGIRTGELLDLFNITVLILQALPIWRVVSHCQLFVKEVEQFYNRTYYYLLTHEHKIEGRMEFHLGMKRKFVFSAGGMFNVDFQLISGMVTTAATYIVVLLQFTIDKEQLGPASSLKHE